MPKWLKRLKEQDEEKKEEGKRGLVPQPPGLDVQLYNYQLESLTWMRKVEERVNKGK